jgi:hypothetical protein
VLVEALGELQGELEDVVRGFVVGVARVRGVLEAAEGGEAGEGEGEGEVPSETREEQKEPEAEEPRVSILPIEPEPGRQRGGELELELEKEYIFVGRSKEEVERRLGEAGVNEVEEEN